MQIYYGLLNPPINEQLEAQGLIAEEYLFEGWERNRKAIISLNLGGFLTDKQANACFSKLTRKIASNVKPKVTTTQAEI